MIRDVLPAFAFIVLLAGCSSIKPLPFTTNKQSGVADHETKKEVKFLDISSADDDNNESRSNIKGERSSGITASTSTTVASGETGFSKSGSSEAARAYAIRLKYSELLNTDAEEIQNIPLYKTIDDWYGTQYRLGGTTKDGIDCSAFVQTIFASVFGISLPRMAKDQYKQAKRISRTELKEGDLLFFNTRGGVSHVGIYLQNNKFVHASVSGVMISDMFEDYYVKHFISAGRVSGIGYNSSASVRP